MSNWPITLHLTQGDEVLAVLELCRPSGEMFWATCAFKPNAGFARVEHIIRQASNILDDDDVDQFEALYAQLGDMGVRLVNVETGEIFEYFIIHLNGDRAEVRY